MLFRVPPLELVTQIGCHVVEVLLDAVVHAVAFHNHLVEVVVENVAHHANRHVRLALQQLRTLAVQELLALALNLGPLVGQPLEILRNRLFGRPLGRGANDHTHVLRCDLRDDRLQAVAFAVAELAAHAGHAAGWHEHKEAPGERHLARQSCALVPDRVFRHLHEHGIARLECELDPARLTLQTRGVPVHLAGVQHTVAGLADVHECGLHARQHVLHTAKVDVAHGGDLLDVGDVMLDEHVVFDHRDLRMASTFTHNHEPVHVLAAREEVLFEQLVLAAAFTAVVATALLLRLETRRAFDIGDLIDVLLLA